MTEGERENLLLVHSPNDHSKPKTPFWSLSWVETVQAPRSSSGTFPDIFAGSWIKAEKLGLEPIQDGNIAAHTATTIIPINSHLENEIYRIRLFLTLFIISQRNYESSGIRDESEQPSSELWRISTFLSLSQEFIAKIVLKVRQK